jgi:hypothetical protein
MPAWLMEDLHSKIDWNAPDAEARAKALIRQHWIAYLRRYQQQGDSALAVYYDSPTPYSLADGLRSVLDSAKGLWRELPDLASFDWRAGLIAVLAGFAVLRGWGLGAILAIASIAGIALRSIG